MTAFWRRTAYFEAYATRVVGRSRWIWLFALFVALGVAITLAMDAMAQRKGEVLALLTLLIVPAALVLLTLGLAKSVDCARSITSQFTSWHVLWMLIFASALVFRTRGVNQIYENPLDAWAIYRIALEFIVAAVLLTHLAVRRPDWLGPMFRGFVGILTVFGLVCAASTAWSVFPVWTLYKSCEYLLDLALLTAILESVRAIKAFEFLFNWTWVLYGLLLVSTWLGVIWSPQAALYPTHMEIGLLGIRLAGVFPQLSSDDVGVFAAMLALVSLCRLLPITGGRRSSGRTWYLIGFTACLVTMVLSQTRSAIAGFLLGVFLLLHFSKRLRASAVLAFLLGPLLLLTSAGGVLWTFLERGETQQQLSTLSSRLVWWSFAWRQLMQRPLLGFGAYAAGRFAVLAQLGMSKTSSLHSDFLEILVGTSIWGMVPFLVALMGIWWFLSRYLHDPHSTGQEKQLAYEAIVVLGLLSLNSLLLPMLTWQAPQYFLVIVGYAEFLRRRRATAYALSRNRRQTLYPEPAARDATS
jgi:O-antigen ligase